MQMQCFPAIDRPRIRRDHVDGPVLTMRDGSMHWLTIGERVLLWLGLTDEERLEAKYRPNLAPRAKA